MSYTDAQKAAYWKKKALQGSSKPKYSKNKYNKGYVKAKSESKDSAEARRVARKQAAIAPGIISQIGGGVGGKIGKFLGNEKFGNFLGSKAGHLIEQITGFGDYQLQGNSIMTGCLTPPQVVNSVNKGCIIVRHREYLGDIPATSAFTVRDYPINPGMVQTFPWLSQIASAFEQYRMRGCLFEFLSTSSDALLMSASSSALGTVNMATEYDSLESNFGSKREMLNHEFSNSRKPSLSFIHPIECKRNRTPVSELYVRHATPPTGADLRLYDLGKFQIATEGMQSATGVVGELWVTYEVELFKAKFDPISFADGATDHFRLIAPTNAAPFGTDQAAAGGGSTLGGSITGGNRYNWPGTVTKGTYLIFYEVTWSVNAVLTRPSIATATNCVAENWFKNNTTQVVGLDATTNQSNAWFCCVYTVTGSPASLSVGAGTNYSTTNFTGGDLWVIHVSDGLSSLPAAISDRVIETPVVESEDDETSLIEEQIEKLKTICRTNSKKAV